ncbi:MAG: LysE family translocator [Hyphomicrobiaceae bacterium]|nr:LysE family translocator [Hyphomicrobiaceae bacterium]
MSFTILAAYVATCVLLAVTPGPNMALIISATLSGGLGAGIATLTGCLTGLAILVTIAAVGMTSVMVLMAEWFDLVRWIGAIYLVVLGARQLLGWWRLRRSIATASAMPVQPARQASARSRYLQGVAVSVSNPKVLLFLGAFFPQFVSPDAPPGPQLALLAGLFVVVLTAVDLSYTVAIAKARSTVDMTRLRMLDMLSGVLLVAGGLVLAAARRP